VLKKPPRTNAAVNGGGAIANAAAAAAAGDGTDIPVDLKAVAANAASCYIVDTLLPCKAGSVAAGVTRPDPIGIGQVSGSAAAGDGKADGDAGAGAPAASSCAELTVVPVLLPLVTSLSSLRVTLPDDIRPLDVRQNLLLVLQVGPTLGCSGIPRPTQNRAAMRPVWAA
jgi:ATP-dependent RNA helicase DOB1